MIVCIIKECNYLYFQLKDIKIKKFDGIEFVTFHMKKIRELKIKKNKIKIVINLNFK